MTESNHLKNWLKQLSRSDIAWAAVLFLVIDLICRLGFFGEHNQDLTLTFDAPYRSRSWWAIKDFLRQTSTPDLLLLGASDMTAAVCRADATFLKTDKQELLTHRSEFLERKLIDLGSPYKTSFCLAIPGEMPSDAYFLVKTLFVNRAKPKAIYFSLTPRDFCDATFGDPSTSDIYKIMSKFDGIGSFEWSCRSSLWDKLDFLCTKGLAGYGHKWELMTWQQQAAHSCLSKILPQTYNSIRTPEPIRKMSLTELPEDFAADEIVEHPYDPKNPEFKSNMAEYRARYRQFKSKTFVQQLEFFERLCQLCQSEGIYLVVGNSPLLPENRALLSRQVYDSYLTELSRTVKKYGGKFVNLDMANVFSRDDFKDTIHLNGKGGEKFLEQIALVLASSSDIASVNKERQ